MTADSGVELESLKVDGGMVVNETLMQFQADILGVPVIRPKVAETTALGAAYAAGLATGFWSTEEELRENWVEDKRWEPKMDEADARDGVPLLEEGGRADVRLGRVTSIRRLPRGAGTGLPRSGRPATTRRIVRPSKLIR